MELVLFFITSSFLAFYLILNLQWYNYKLKRVIFNHTKKYWHLLFIVPWVLYYTNFWLYLLPIYIVVFILWYKRLTNKLVFTDRIKRFFAIFIVVSGSFGLLSYLYNQQKIVLLIPLFLALIISNVIEFILFLNYKSKAKEKLKDTKIILVTASYGKTSIKHFLAYILEKKFKTYYSPGSVNTIKGIVADVNNNLDNFDIYVAEAGARERGDILEITNFLEPHYSIIGKVGKQHIEYFKTIDNIILTKVEVLQSKRLIKGFIHESVPLKKYDNIITYPKNLKILKSNLEGIEFSVEINGSEYFFKAPILGSFNAINLTASILVAIEFGFSIEELQDIIKTMPQVKHRLEKIIANNKIILDDSFNGNFEGMSEAIKLASLYPNRKVIVTPGLVESDIEDNIKLAKNIDKVFDLVIITGSLNKDILDKNISKEKIILKDKHKLQEVLANNTKENDLILFANDAPNFI